MFSCCCSRAAGDLCFLREMGDPHPCAHSPPIPVRFPNPKHRRGPPGPTDPGLWLTGPKVALKTEQKLQNKRDIKQIYRKQRGQEGLFRFGALRAARRAPAAPSAVRSQSQNREQTRDPRNNLFGSFALRGGAGGRVPPPPPPIGTTEPRERRVRAVPSASHFAFSKKPKDKKPPPFHWERACVVRFGAVGCFVFFLFPLFFSFFFLFLSFFLSLQGRQELLAPLLPAALFRVHNAELRAERGSRKGTRLRGLEGICSKLCVFTISCV